jgi:hypothetical protein
MTEVREPEKRREKEKGQKRGPQKTSSFQFDLTWGFDMGL